MAVRAMSAGEGLAMADSKKQHDREDGPLFSAIVADASPGSHAVPAGPLSIEVKAARGVAQDRACPQT